MNLEKQLESTHRFIGEVAQELNNPEDRERAYRLVRTGFSVLRDRLTIEESFNLLSQLPFFLKAVYVDGWRPQAKTRRVKHLSELLEEARKVEPRTSARDLGNDERTEEALRAVFRVLKRQITEGESSHIEASFPEELREFWVDA